MRSILRGLPAVAVILFYVLFLKASIPSVPTGTWVAGAALSQPRTGATATLMPDGRVLIAGGKDADGNALASVDLFNADGTVTAAPAMATPRYGHSAIFLMDGYVLVAGGHTTSGGVVNTAELFDPLTNTWQTLPGTMADARADFTMSQLQDGDVLVVAGDNGTSPVSSFEKFSLTANAFQYVGTLSNARKAHAAAALNDGRVIIAGGSGLDSNGSAVALNSTEIYDPSSNSFSAGPSLNTARFAHTATTLIDGTVLLAGGNDGTNDLASAEIYDPLAGTITASTASLAAPRSNHTAVLLPNNNSVLIAGGTSAGTELASTEIYQSWNHTFLANAPMSTARVNAVSSALATDGIALLAGGSNQSSTELYGFGTVKTDKNDYAPGEVVTITGSGWKPGETVTLSLLESPNVDSHGPFTAVADAAGNIVNAEFVPDQQDMLVRFYLTAVGADSGVQAHNTFTDAISVNKIPTVGTQSPTPVPAGNSTTYALTVTFNGSGSPCTATLGIGSPGLPTGATASFGPNPVPSSGSPVPVTLTVSTTAGTTPVGSSTFQITTTAATTCGGSAATNPGGTGGNAANPTLAVSKANQTISVSQHAPASAAYNATFPVTAAATSGLAVAITSTGSCSGSGSNTANITMTSGSGSCTVHYNQAGNTNYNAAPEVTESATATKATPTITWNNPADIAYGTALSGTQLNATASVPGSFVYTPPSGAVPGAGLNQTLHVDFTPTDTGNYASVSKDVTINVTKVHLTVKADDKSKPYDGSPYSPFTATITGFANGDTSTVVSGSPSFSGSASGAINAGSYTITPALGNLTATNYDFTVFQDGTLNINKVHLTVKADDKSKTYDGSIYAPFTATISGFVNNETETALRAANALTGTPTFTGSATSGINAGNYTITPTLGSLTATNYDFTVFTGGSLVINKAHLTIKADDQQKTYDGAIFSPFTTTLTGFVNSETDSGLRAANALSGAAGFTGNATTAVNAGSYTITPTSGTLSATNYDFPTLTNGALTINKAHLTVKADDKSKTYDGSVFSPFTATISGFVNSETESGLRGSGALTGSPLFVGTASTAVNAGNYTITPTSGTLSATNYDFPTLTNGSLTINKAHLSVKADDKSKTYDGAVFTEFTTTLSGFVNSETDAGLRGSGALSGAAEFSGSATTAVNASTYTITPTIGGLTATNYDFSSFLDGTLTINKVHLTVKAEDKTKVYDALPFSPFTATISGFANGENSNVVSGIPTFSGDAVGAVNAGTYTIIPAGGSLTATNYDFTIFQNGALLIQQAPSTTTVICPPSVTYNGSAQTPCTASVTGAGGLSESLTVSYSNNVNAGTASANANFTGDNNHLSSNDSKNFTINQAPVTATAGSYSGTYDGLAHAPSSCAVTGAYTGDLSCSNNPASVGPDVSAGAVLPIVSGTGLSNFAITPVDGSYGIIKASSSTAVSCPASVTYNGSAQTPCTASVTGVGNLNQALTVSYSSNINAGTATANAAYGGDTNHFPSSDSKTFTINQAPVTATAGIYSGTYDGSAHSPSACAITGAYTGDLSCTNNPASVGPDVSAGTVLPVVTGTGLGNFAIASVDGSYSISQASSTTTVICPAAVIYNGGAQTPCTASVAGAGSLSQALTVNYTNNITAGIASASASFGGDVNHTGSNDSKNFTIEKAVVTATAGSYSAVYDGAPHAPSTCVVAGVFTGDLSCTNNPSTIGPDVSSGSVIPSVNGSGLTNFDITLVNRSFAITIAPSQVVLTCPVSVTYNGTAQTPCTAVATGAGGLNHNLIVSYTSNIDFGTATASASYAGDVNHTSSTDSKNFQIAKAPVTATAGSYSSIYDGSPHSPSSCTVTGAYTGDLSCANVPNSVGPDVSSGSVTPATTGTSLTNFDITPVNGSYSITPAPSIIALSCPTNVTYSGSAQTPCNASVSGAGGLSQILTVGYSNNINAGTATANVTYPGDTNHSANGATKMFTIDKATPIISWSNPANIVYGTALSSIQLNATANVPGAFVYNPASGTVLGVGVQSLGTTFTPADTANYNNASKSVNINVTAWTLSGFYQPISMSGGITVWNTIKGGQTVPVKFNIYAGSVEQKTLAAVPVGSITVYSVFCSNAGIDDPVDVTNAGGTTLRYDGSQFIQNWQTPKGAGACYLVRMTAADGSKLEAYFKTK